MKILIAKGYKKNSYYNINPKASKMNLNFKLIIIDPILYRIGWYNKAEIQNRWG